MRKHKKRKGAYAPEEDMELEEDTAEEEAYEEEEEDSYQDMPKRKKVKSRISESDAFTLKTVGRFMIPVGICLIILVASFSISPKLAGDRTEDLQAKADQIGKLTDETEALQLELNQLSSEAQNGSLAGIYVGKENDAQWQLDDEKASAFFAGITTWSDGESYDDIRKRMLESGYTETDSVMVCFLPKMNDDWDLDENSPTYNQFVREIDKKGLNCSFNGMTSYRIYTDGAQSRYVALVDMTSRDMSGSGMTAEAHAYVKYTVEAATGTLSGVEAYVLDD